MPEKRYLFTPGPTPVPPEVLAAAAEPVVHHRGPDFKAIYDRTLARLKEVFRTEHDVLLFTASGTGAFESAVANLVEPGERHLVVSSGNFGERWAEMVAAYGAELVHLRCRGASRRRRRRSPRSSTEGPVKAVYLVHSETSTGVVADVEALARVAKEAGALVVVDAVSSLGAVPLETDAWGLDVVVAGSQKALMAPPGLGMASVSPAALEAVALRAPLLLRLAADADRRRRKLDAPFTPAVTLVKALDVALGLILEEGLEAAFARHVRLGRACREGIKAMGLELASPDEDRAAVVTTVRAPDDLDVRLSSSTSATASACS